MELYSLDKELMIGFHLGVITLFFIFLSQTNIHEGLKQAS